MANSKRSKAMKQAWQRRKAGLTKNESDVAAAVSETAPKKPLWERQIDAKEAEVQKVIGKALLDGQVLPEIVRHIVDVKRSLNEIRSMIATPPNGNGNGGNITAHSVEVSKRLDSVTQWARQSIEGVQRSVDKLRQAVDPDTLTDIGERIDDLDTRLEDLDSVLTNLTTEVEKLKLDTVRRKSGRKGV
jgi:hypothetical protein